MQTAFKKLIRALFYYFLIIVNSRLIPQIFIFFCKILLNLLINDTKKIIFNYSGLALILTKHIVVLGGFLFFLRISYI